MPEAITSSQNASAFSITCPGNATQGGIPIVMLIIGVLSGVYWFALNRTVYGRNVYAVGGNRKAAILSGIDTKATDFKIFLNMGFLTSIAAVITLSRLASATAQTGMEFEMDAIAACFIGGTAVTGGIGTIPGAMVGALIMGVLNQGLSIMGVDAAWVKTIKGLVVIAAVAYDLVSKRKKGRFLLLRKASSLLLEGRRLFRCVHRQMNTRNPYGLRFAVFYLRLRCLVFFGS